MGQHLPFPSSPLAGLDGISKNQQKSPEIGAGEFPQRSLGRTGVKVPALGIGGHYLGDFKLAKDAIRLGREAVDAGITLMRQLLGRRQAGRRQPRETSDPKEPHYKVNEKQGHKLKEKIMNTASHPFDQFAERLNKLERRNRRLTSMLVLLLVASGLVLLGAAQKPKRQSSDMESFVLRDSAGKERARLEMGKEGPALQFLNDRGQPLASVGTSKDALLLRLFDRNGHLQTGVSLENDGVALINYDRDGQLQRGRGALLFTNGVLARD